jgi:hypothetical protein
MVNSAGGAIAMVDGGHNTVVNNACDMSAASMHGVAVFPNACRDSYQLIRGNDFYAQDPTGKYWYDGSIYNSLGEWEAAAHQSGNVCSLPGFVRPDSGDLHLATGSVCIDRGTPDSAATVDFDGLARPQGAGYDIGAFEYVPVAAAELGGAEWFRPVAASIVRGALGLGKRGQSTTEQSLACLLDAAGRKVMALRPGANDVRHLSQGVYFVRPASGVEREVPRVTKVVVVR